MSCGQMKINSFYFTFAFFVLLFFSTQNSYAQQKQIDSLNQLLSRFEAQKKELGPNASDKIDTVKIPILSKLVEKSFQNSPDKAMDYAWEQLEISEKNDHKWGISNAYNSIGVLYERKGNYNKSLEYYKKSLSIKQLTNDKEGQIDTYANIGTLNAKISNTPEAISNLIKALEISKKINDKFGIAGVSNNLGVIYRDQKNYTEALKYFNQSLKVAQETKDLYFASVIYQNLGEIYMFQNKLDAAMVSLQKGLKFAIETQDKISMANNYSGIGRVLQERKQYDKALQNYLIALKLRQEVNDTNGISNSYVTIGYLWFKLKDNKKAILNIEKGLSAAKANGEMDIVAEAYKYFSEIYETSGNYKLAYQNLEQYKLANDSIFNTEKEKKISQLQIRYNYKSMQDSLQAVQEKKNIIAQDEVKRQKTTRNFIFIGLGLVVLFLIILIIQRNKIAKIKRQKALEEERNRISRDLHDNLGAQLSTARMFVSSLKHDNESLTETIDNTVGLLDNSILELRKIMNETSASTLHEKGFLAATEELANKINQLHFITFTLSHHNIDKRPEFKIEHELYRIIQELVNNTLKYAEAKNISIDLLKRDGILVLMYEDDGKGYDIASVLKGNGLNNIEFRVQSVNGTIEFDSMPGAGSRTIVEIPLK